MIADDTKLWLIADETDVFRLEFNLYFCNWSRDLEVIF